MAADQYDKVDLALDALLRGQMAMLDAMALLTRGVGDKESALRVLHNGQRMVLEGFAALKLPHPDDRNESDEESTDGR